MRDLILANLSGGGDFDPILIAPDQSTRVTACLRSLANHPDARQLATGIEAFQGTQDNYWPAADSWESRYKPYVVHNNVLLIPVKGILLHDFPYAIGGYATGYYYIQRALQRGLADPDVKGIAFIVDSPGGHVAGCFELCDKIFAARSEKPLSGFAHEHAYSAAYAIISSATDVTISRTGGVGSIGVVTMHVSYEKMLEEVGVEVTFIFAGKYKTAGNPYEALSDDAKDRIQRRIDDTHTVFVRQVARNRKMKESTVRGTEALTFTAGEAVDRVLADKIGPLDESLAAFGASLEVEEQEHDEMSKETTTQPAPGVSQADHDAAVAAATQAGANAAKARISGILALDESKDRSKLANHIAMNTNLSVDEAKGLLAASAKEVAEAPKTETKPETTNVTNIGDNRFAKAMDESKKGPGAGEDKDDVELTAEQKADATKDRILGNVFGPRTAKK